MLKNYFSMFFYKIKNFLLLTLFYKIKNFLLLTLISLNYYVIPFFLYFKLYFITYLLLRVNMRPIKNLPISKSNIKFKVVVLSKSGGLEDIIASQKNYNKNIKYHHLSRAFFKAMFEYFIKDHASVHDYKYLNKSQFIRTGKKNYRKALINIIKILRDNYKIDAFIGFNFCYKAERELHAACRKLNIKFIVLHKESVFSPAEDIVVKNIYKNYTGKFEGYRIGTYSDQDRKRILGSKMSIKKQIETVGCPRIDKTFAFRKIIPKNTVVYYMIENFRGLPEDYLICYHENFKKQFSFYNDKRYSNLTWSSLQKDTVQVLIKLAKENINTQFIFKGKVGSHSKKDLPPNMPKNCKMIFGGSGEKLLKEAKLVVGWNSSVILEAMAANRFILTPSFGLKKKDLFKKKFLIDFKLDPINEGYSKKDFEKKFKYFIKKPYNKKSKNYKSKLLKHYFNNIDGSAGKKLDNFLQKNLAESF